MTIYSLDVLLFLFGTSLLFHEIQNLENKMELQINRLEIRIEKIQKMFKKDLEEIKKSQSIMNNAITEIKSTL